MEEISQSMTGTSMLIANSQTSKTKAASGTRKRMRGHTQTLMLRITGVQMNVTSKTQFAAGVHNVPGIGEPTSR